MNKPLDFEELWDSFSVAERQLIRDELSQVDWEFTLGRRFHA